MSPYCLTYGAENISHCQQLSSLGAQQHTALQGTEWNALGESAKENPLRRGCELESVSNPWPPVNQFLHVGQALKPIGDSESFSLTDLLSVEIYIYPWPAKHNSNLNFLSSLVVFLSPVSSLFCHLETLARSPSTKDCWFRKEEHLSWHLVGVEL